MEDCYTVDSDSSNDDDGDNVKLSQLIQNRQDYADSLNMFPRCTDSANNHVANGTESFFLSDVWEETETSISECVEESCVGSKSNETKSSQSTLSTENFSQSEFCDGNYDLPDLESSLSFELRQEANCDEVLTSLALSDRLRKEAQPNSSGLLSSSVPSEVPRKKRAQKAEEIGVKKRKDAEREEKRRQKERRKLEQLTQKQLKPGECLKHLTVCFDARLCQSSFGPSLMSACQANSLRFELEQQPVPAGLVTWRREVTNIRTVDDEVDTSVSEQLEDQVLILLPLPDFLACIMEDDISLELLSRTISAKLNDSRCHFLVTGLATYLREQSNRKNKKFQDKVRGAIRPNKTSKLPEVPEKTINQAIVKCQLFTKTSFLFLEKDEEVVKAVVQMSKAIAEAPFKREKMQSCFSFFAESSSGSGKIEKDGRGLTNAWRLQLQQFRGVTADVANAIITKYPSPLRLWEAYEACSSKQEGEELLKDIMVRRGYGVLETNRKIGIEFSKLMHKYFTSATGTEVVE